MTAQSVLFVGGTGIISSACVQRALERGARVTVLNRGVSSTRPSPVDVETLTADVHDSEAVRTVLGSAQFDTVAEFVAFKPEHVTADIETFAGRVGQYVFISSASAYQTPPARVPIVESTPLRNPFWAYSRDKIACEDMLMRAYRESAFPATIVRPSHTYDHTALPTLGGWTDIARMRAGKPVVVHGDGTSLWTLTHSMDFAVAFTGLLGRQQAIGESYHITSDEWLTWDQIYTVLAKAAGAAPHIVHVASDAIAEAYPELGPGLLGDRAHSSVFDNSKVKALVPEFHASVPFATGARQIIDWYDADPSRQMVDPELDALFDRLSAGRDAHRPTR